MNNKSLVALAALAIVVTSIANAEDPAQLALKVADAHAANFAKLQYYSWSIDSELTQEGVVKGHVVTRDRFNEKGELVYEVLKAESSVKRKRGLRGRAQQSQMEQVSAFLGHVVSVTASYAIMSKGEQVDFFDKATITEGSGEEAGMIIAEAKVVSVPGDKVTKWLDAETLLPRKIVFEAVVDEVPVSGEILYRPIDGGPNVPRMATIEIPSQQGVIEAEFIDYEKEL